MNLSTLYTYGEFGVLSAAGLPVVAAARGVSMHDPSRRMAGRTLRRLARTIARLSATWRFRVDGGAGLGPGPFVVVSNHASVADPFLLSFLPLDMRFVAKAELFDLPLVGWLLRLSGDIPLRRGDAASARAMHAACVTTLALGTSVMIFPEGTRSRSGDLGTFRRGAFKVAVAAGATILPVALHGTAACVADGGVRRASARAEILAPIATAGLGDADVDALAERTRASIARALSAPEPEVVDSFFLDGPLPAR